MKLNGVTVLSKVTLKDGDLISLGHRTRLEILKHKGLDVVAEDEREMDFEADAGVDVDGHDPEDTEMHPAGDADDPGLAKDGQEQSSEVLSDGRDHSTADRPKEPPSPRSMPEENASGDTEAESFHSPAASSALRPPGEDEEIIPPMKEEKGDILERGSAAEDRNAAEDRSVDENTPQKASATSTLREIAGGSSTVDTDGPWRPLAVHPKSKERISVGRSRNNTIVIRDDLKVSRCHFYIERGLLKDLSRLGTFVNGTKMKTNTWRLQPGDRVAIGLHTRFKVQFAKGGSQGVAPASLMPRGSRASVKTAASRKSGAARAFGAEVRSILISRSRLKFSGPMSSRESLGAGDGRTNAKDIQSINLPSAFKSVHPKKAVKDDNDDGDNKPKMSEEQEGLRTRRKMKEATSKGQQGEAKESKPTCTLPTPLWGKSRGRDNHVLEAGAKVETFTGERSCAELGAGDSSLILNFLSEEEAASSLRKLKDPSQVYVQMYSKNSKPLARLKRVEGSYVQNVSDGEHGGSAGRQSVVPVYRYPVLNQSSCPIISFQPATERIRERCAKYVSQPLNHCVTNYYRSERDFIGLHSDKMLDIKTNSKILSYSLGATRPLVLVKNDGTHQQTVYLPHNSLFVLGPKTNAQYKHAIPRVAGSVGVRVSLTIRRVASYTTEEEATRAACAQSWNLGGGASVKGQGAKHQTLNWPFWDHENEVEPTYCGPDGTPKTKEEYWGSREKTGSSDKEILASRGKKNASRIALEAKSLSKHTINGQSFEAFILRCECRKEALELQRALRDRFPRASHVPMSIKLSDGGCLTLDDGELQRVMLSHSLAKILFRHSLVNLALLIVRQSVTDHDMNSQNNRIGVALLKKSYTQVAEQAASLAATQKNAATVKGNVLPGVTKSNGLALSKKAPDVIGATPEKATVSD